MNKILYTLVILLLPSMASAYTAMIDGIYYDFNSTKKTAKVTFLYNNLYTYVYSNTSNKNAYTGNVTIPCEVAYNNVIYSVTSIGEGAFFDCSGLTSVSIPNSVTSIGQSAFNGCSGLTSIIIHDRVTSIGERAFAKCSGLTTIKVESGNSVFDSRDNCNAIIETKLNRLLVGCKSTIIPNNITSIEWYAFSGCSGLTSVNIPNSVTSIGQHAFYGCSGLTTITIPNSVTTMGLGAFENCNNITSVSISNNLTSIENQTFQGCYSLTSVTIPNSVKSIGTYAFQNCTSLKSISLGSGVTSIDQFVFNCCTSLTSVTIPNSMTTIGFGAFDNCKGLNTLIYTGEKSPSNWIATTNTYVPNKSGYVNPSYINGANSSNIKEMVSLENEFAYTGVAPIPTWTNNVKDYTADLTFPILKTNSGSYKETITGTFTKDKVSFTVNISFEYSIKQTSLTVAASNLSREYGDDNPNLIFTYSGFVNGENENVFTTNPTISTTATKKSDVGNYPITISGGKANNYTFVYKSGILTVTKAPLTAKVNDASKQYGKDNPTFSVSYTGLKNNETAPKWTESLKIETTATKQSDVGTYAITATGVPTNYDLQKIEDGTLTITQVPLTLKANDATRKYFEEEPEFTFTCSGFVNGDDAQVLTKAPTFTTEATKTSNVGKYKITPSEAEAKNYTISYEQGELTITKQTLKATSHCSRQYGEENPVLPIEYEGFVNDEDEKVLSTKPVATTTATKTSTIGDYPITVSGGEAKNYDIVCEQGVLTVTKAALSAKVSDATKVYGEDNPTFTIEYSGLKNDETIPTWTTKPTIQTEATKTSGVGEYAIKAIDGVAANYDMEIDDGTLTITPAPLTLKANDATRKYFEEEPEFTYICSGFVNGDDAQVLTKAPTFTIDATKTSNVGKYQITPSGAEAKNYEISYEPGELTITKRTLKATSHCSRHYGEENPVLPIEYDGFVNDETESVLTVKPIGTTNATKTSTIGDYPITISGGEATNYDLVYEQGVLTIVKAPLSAKVSDATKVYGEDNPTFTIEYYGLKNEETVPTWSTKPTFQTKATKVSGVGKYAISAVDGVPVNYELSIDDGTLTITPAPLTIRVDDATRQYYSDNPTFSYSCSGFVNGEDISVLASEPTLSTSATLSSNVGTYEIELSETSSPNYSISYVNGTLTITKAPLTISAGDYTKEVGEDNPPFVLTFTGFKNGETKSVLTCQPTVSCTATKISPVGVYSVIVSDAEAQNYVISYINGTLTIKENPLGIISFSDANVKAFCIMKWDTNGDGELSKQEAAAVKDIETVFQNNKVIKSFNELSYFTGLTSIRESAFSGCSTLSSITIPESVTSIEYKAFYGCSSLNSIIIPNAVTHIGESAFSNCTGLISVIIGSGVISIGNNAFYNTNIAKTIWLTNTPPSGYSKASGAINYVANNQYGNLNRKVVYQFISSLFEVDGVYYVPVSPSDRTCDAIDCKYNEMVANTKINPTVSYKDIAMNVQKIQPYLFYNNKYIEILECYNNGTIADYAFAGCINLESAVCNNEGNIGNYAFKGCNNLKRVVCKNNGNITNYAFAGCINLESVVCDINGLIGDNAFESCSNMASLLLGEKITSIGKNSFKNCSSLPSVTIPNSVTTLGESSFNGCKLITKISIPKSVIIINDYAFYACTGLKEVVIEDRTEELTLGSNGSSPLFSDCPLDNIYIGGNISYNTQKNYGYSPFYRNTSLRKVVITDRETEISPNEFYGCSNLQSFSIGDGVTTFGDWAFSGCSSLKSLSFGTQLKNIGKETFSDCIAVTQIYSRTVIPPTCGVQALDDINKWNCTLTVPKGSLISYQEAEQWKEFFYMEEGAVLIGDANGDNIVNTADIVEAVNFMNGHPSSKFVFSAADMNNDGNIDKTDINLIINKIISN